MSPILILYAANINQRLRYSSLIISNLAKVCHMRIAPFLSVAVVVTNIESHIARFGNPLTLAYPESGLPNQFRSGSEIGPDVRILPGVVQIV